jgi:hypothetical protein
MRLPIFYCIFLCLYTLFGFGQTDISAYPKHKIQVKAHTGFVWMHRQGVEHLVQRGVSGVQVDFLIRPSGKADWHEYAEFPDVGISLIHMRLSSAELGEAIGVVPYLRIFNVKRNRFCFSGSGGLGLGYLNNPWNRTDNRKNEMIGSHLNLAVTLQSDIGYAFTKNWQFMAGFAFTHFSNAGTRKPNLGVNIPSAFMGIRYSAGVYDQYSDKRKTTLLKHQRELVLSAAGFTNQYDVLSPQRLAITSSIEMGFFSETGRNRWHFGTDLFYNGELEDFYRTEQIDYGNHHLYQLGVSGGYSRIIGKMSVYLGSGVYVLSHELPSLRVYNRVGMRYNVGDKWILNGTVKTHLFVADYFELGLGYRLWKK